MDDRQLRDGEHAKNVSSMIKATVEHIAEQLEMCCRLVIVQAIGTDNFMIALLS